jgi:multimeric flavodoxin WrbA
MKTVILFGSPRKDGNTRQLVDAFTTAVRSKQHDIRLLYLNDMNIRPCQGCMGCMESGVCRINDDMRDVSKYIMESDLIVYATPVYWFAPSGQLKLAIDRCVAFFDKEYNSRIKGKKAITLMSCADQDSGTFQPAVDMFKKTFETLGVEYLGGVQASGCQEKASVAEETLDAARSLAETL